MLLVWKKGIRKKITYKLAFSGTEQGAMLKIMAKMDRCPGCRPKTVNYPTTCGNFDKDIGDTESIRTQYHQTNPHPESIP